MTTVWEAKLHVRKCAIEFKIRCLQERYAINYETREGLFKSSGSYEQLTDRLQAIDNQLDREREELKFVDGLLNVGPIKGGEIALVVRRNSNGQKIDVPHSRSLMNIIADRANEYREWSEDYESGNERREELLNMAAGLDEAYAIIVNPRDWLNDDEKTSYDAIPIEVDKVIEKPPRSGSSTQIARELVDDEVVTRRPKGERIMKASTLEVAVAESADDDVVVRRR